MIRQSRVLDFFWVPSSSFVPRVPGHLRRGTRIWRTSVDVVGAAPSAFEPKVRGSKS